MDQAGDVDLLFGQRADGFLEGSAAAADDLDFVDDQRREVQGFAGGEGAFEDDGSAGADHLHGEFETARAAGAIDDNILIVSRGDVFERATADRPFLAK